MRLLIIAVIILIALGALFFIGRNYFTNSPRPEGVGTGTIAPCPSSPNCVSSQAAVDDSEHHVQPIPLTQSAVDTLDQLQAIIEAMPNSTIVQRTDGYLYAEFRTPTWHFVDDVEFFVNESEGIIDGRSGARIGYSDTGVNRARYKKILKSLGRS